MNPVRSSVLLLLVTAGCTSASLFKPPPPTPEYRQHVAAQLCAPQPIVEEEPYRILFVIDTSFSNSWNDPTARRADAVRQAIASQIGKATVAFGIITFSDAPRLQTFGYTRDLMVLNGATQNIASAQGGTNYSDTLWAMINFIMNDANALDAPSARRTHYLTFWLSDGIPTVGVTEHQSLIPALGYLRNTLGDRVAEIRLNTAFLGGVSPTTDQERMAAGGLLEQMAQAGAGAFANIPAGEAFQFDLDTSPRLRSFTFLSAYAENRHTRLGEAGALIDSDADGIDDETEIAANLDPSVADTDKDGFRDGVELLRPGLLDPTKHDGGCTGTAAGDKDGDGLRDCEETVLGTNVGLADTDGDEILDSTEIRMGTSALADDPVMDTDLDGLPDQTEVTMHLPPRAPNKAEETGGWAYRYSVEPMQKARPEDPPCYALAVENLSMVETMAGEDRPHGGNVFEVVAAFRPEDGGDELRFLRAEIRGRLVLPDSQDPVNGRFNLEPGDFLPLVENATSASPFAHGGH